MGPAHNCFYCRTLFQLPIIAVSAFGVRRGSLGFNGPQESFSKGISFSPLHAHTQLLSDYYTKTNLTAYSQKRHTHWRSRKDFLLSQVNSQLTAASSFQILLLKEKLENRPLEKGKRNQNLQSKGERTVFLQRASRIWAQCPPALAHILVQLSRDLHDSPWKHFCVFHTESHSNIMTQAPK